MLSKYFSSLLGLLLALFVVYNAQAQPILDSPIPIDSSVTIGELDNGITYYLRENHEPESRLELRLVVNAGSLMEDEDQLGLAHFVEHMLFNGTERFPKQTLIAFLQRIGMQIGPDINAYTSFDETVYQLQVPTDSIEVVRKAFQVLEDWAAYATISDEEIDNERGVVIEEWRTGRGASGRMLDQMIPTLLGDSRYAERLPIGDTLVIKNSDYETVRRFYKSWYRPDLMGIVVVGSMDTETMESLVVEHFNSLPVPENVPPRLSYEVPALETRYKVVTDPEYNFFPQISLLFRQPTIEQNTISDHRQSLVRSLATQMLSRRFAEISQDGAQAPFLLANAGVQNLVRDVSMLNIFAYANEDSLVSALRTLILESERVRQHSFTAGEFTRVKDSFLRSLEEAYNERENTPSASHAAILVNHYLEAMPIPGAVNLFYLAQALLPTITLDEVSAYLPQALSSLDRAVIVDIPEKESLDWVTEDLLASTFEEYIGTEVEPYVDTALDVPLFTETLSSAAVIKVDSIPEIGVTEITLENGIRVVMKPTDFRADEVQFTSFSEGGTSLYSDDEYLSASYASRTVSNSGVGEFNETALQKEMAGKRAFVTASISGLYEGFSGEASPEDLELLFQLIHLRATQARLDSSSFLSQININRTFLINRANSPDAAFFDTLETTLYMDHPRYRTTTVEELDAIDQDRVFQIYQERFEDMDDFVFIFVGAFDVDHLTSLSQTYLGTLPTTEREETWKDIGVQSPEGSVVKSVYMGQEPQSRVAIVFNGPTPYTPEASYHMESLEMLFDILLFEELREELGGVYGAGVNGSITRRPNQDYSFTISFRCDPERAEELTNAVFVSIKEVQQNGIDPDYVTRVQEQQRQARTVSLEENGFWLSTLRSAYYSDSMVQPEDILSYNELVDSLTASDLQEATNMWLTDRYVRVTLFPEESSE
ncbi:MAG: insulinase family protein [Bacteroidetes bacterium]|nr:insulinase family protein [Bacteroidota bacterium]MCY4232215.1 insulinase family protein [Bacteroidota bacterium]